MDGEKKYRVYNKCTYDIGITLMSGQQPNIKAGSFIMISVNDILFIEGNAKRKPFSAKMLVAVDPDTSKETALEDLGGFVDENTTPHLDDEEIMSELRKSAKSIDAWLGGIDSPEELHAVYAASRQMDLPQSKLKILSKYMPTKDFLEEEE